MGNWVVCGRSALKLKVAQSRRPASLQHSSRATTTPFAWKYPKRLLTFLANATNSQSQLGVEQGINRESEITFQACGYSISFIRFMQQRWVVQSIRLRRRLPVWHWHCWAVWPCGVFGSASVRYRNPKHIRTTLSQP